MADPSSCAGKRRYTTFAEAARQAQRARGGGQKRTSAYHCEACNGFHVGTRSGPKIRRPRAEHFAADD